MSDFTSLRDGVLRGLASMHKQAALSMSGDFTPVQIPTPTAIGEGDTTAATVPQVKTPAAPGVAGAAETKSDVASAGSTMAGAAGTSGAGTPAVAAQDTMANAAASVVTASDQSAAAPAARTAPPTPAGTPSSTYQIKGPDTIRTPLTDRQTPTAGAAGAAPAPAGAAAQPKAQPKPAPVKKGPVGGFASERKGQGFAKEQMSFKTGRLTGEYKGGPAGEDYPLQKFSAHAFLDAVLEHEAAFNTPPAVAPKKGGRFSELLQSTLARLRGGERKPKDLALLQIEGADTPENRRLLLEAEDRRDQSARDLRKPVELTYDEQQAADAAAFKQKQRAAVRAVTDASSGQSRAQYMATPEARRADFGVTRQGWEAMSPYEQYMARSASRGVSAAGQKQHPGVTGAEGGMRSAGGPEAYRTGLNAAARKDGRGYLTAAKAYAAQQTGKKEDPVYRASNVNAHLPKSQQGASVADDPLRKGNVVVQNPYGFISSSRSNFAGGDPETTVAYDNARRNPASTAEASKLINDQNNASRAVARAELEKNHRRNVV